MELQNNFIFKTKFFFFLEKKNIRSVFKLILPAQNYFPVSTADDKTEVVKHCVVSRRLSCWFNQTNLLGNNEKSFGL
jgi:hypothetical protein